MRTCRPATPFSLLVATLRCRRSEALATPSGASPVTRCTEYRPARLWLRPRSRTAAISGELEIDVSTTVQWQRCSRDACEGARIDQYRECLAHLTQSDLDKVLGDVARQGLDARGVRVTENLMRQIRKASPKVGGRPQLHRALFDGAVFTSIGFDNFVLLEGASFVGARFEDDVAFRDVTFAGKTSFQNANFGSAASFDRAAFEGACSFKGSRFRPAGHERAALFRRARFADVDFAGATFERPALFDYAKFAGDARFDGARFQVGARFERARFAARASFEADPAKPAPTFAQGASFRGASFEAAVSLGAGAFAPSSAVYLDEASFAEPLTLSLCIRELWCRDSHFEAPVLCTVRWSSPAAELTFEGAQFARPSRLAGAEMLGWGEEIQIDQRANEPERPRLISVRRAMVENLAVSGVDLSQCRFAGAHGLDRLRLEGESEFATSPASPESWSPLRPWPPRRRWTPRIVLAEERLWRHGREVDDADWDNPSPWFPETLMRPERSAEDPAEIATIYRALRKGREDSRDEPGAADFYYGEMEMRRHARRKPGGGRTPAAERAILWLYWLISGYGLRASRALMAFALTVAAFALAFDRYGFQQPQTLDRALLISFQSTTSLVIAPAARGLLNDTGELLLTVLRLLGPLLLGLAVLSVRGRVKR
jgi:uncharacterized protein YjbI with pentapeptide repeats